MPLLKSIQQSAVQYALDEWASVVRDPEDADRITEYHRKCGVDWAIEDGYQEHEDFWCGIFLGWCYRVGLYPIREEITAHIFPSTTRLIGHGPRPYDHHTVDAKPPTEIDPENIRAGDICMVQTGRTNRPWGDHMFFAIQEPDNGKLETIEGNAKGQLGNEKYGEGIVRRTRSLDRISKALRPKQEWFHE